MKGFSLFAVFILLAAASSAQASHKDSIQHITLDSMTVSAPPGPPPYQGSAPRVWDIRNTRIALSFNYHERTASASEWVTLHPYFYPTDTLELDAKGMRIDSVMMISGKSKTALRYTYANDVLKIRFNKQFKSSENVELYFKYTAMPYAAQTGGSGAIRDDRGLYFINADGAVPHKPVQIWTQGETESNSHWMITIDKPNTRFTTQVELTVPDTFVTLGNGALIKQVKAAKGLRTDIWKMDQPIQAYAVMFAIGKFKIDKNNWHGKEVSYYVEPEYEQYAYLMFNHTRDMMEFFSKRTGVPYPWNKYSQVVVRDYVSGAMENTTASLFGEFMNQNAREVADRNSEDVVSHELFHQWFGDYVTCESWSNITVNESFANYSEQLWRTFRYGKASGDELAYNDLMGYIGSSSFTDPQLVRFHYDNREEVFDAVSYNKGGAVLRYLNNLMGDEAFDKAMNIYLTKNALHSAEAHQWRLAVEEATGQDWNWFFNEWYYHAGHPEVKITYSYDDAAQKLTVVFSQVQSDSTFMYKLPLKAALIYGDDKTVMDWTVDKRKDSLTFAYKNGQRPVFIPDYTRILPGEIKDVKKMPEWKEQYKHSDDYINKRVAVHAASRLLSDTNSQAIIDMAMADVIHPIRRFALSQIRTTSNDKYRRRWSDYIMSVAKYDSDKLVRAEAFYVLGDWKVSAAKELMVKAVSYSSYAIAGAALEGLAKIDKDTAYIMAKIMVDSNPKTSLESAVWSIICKNAADEDIKLIERHAPWVLGTRRFSFASSLSSYMKNVKSDESYRRAAEVYATMVTTEGMKTYRSMLGGFLFQVGDELKGNLKSADKDEAASAKKRYDILMPILQKMVDAETDPEIMKENKGKMKDIFE